MTIQDIRSRLGDYAKDTKLNLGKVLSSEGAPGLNLNQIYGVALASAYATKQTDLIQAVIAESSATLSEAEIQAAKSAATIMAMNNIYYRFVHLVEDHSYSQMPANLRMQVIGNPGIAKADFELYSLAVSAINGCGMCMKSHVKSVVGEGVSATGVQSAIRIAAVVNATAQALVIDGIH